MATKPYEVAPWMQQQGSEEELAKFLQDDYEQCTDPEVWWQKREEYHNNMIFPSLAEVQVLVNTRSAEVISNWTSLRAVVSTHMELIAKRWVKKSKKGEQSLLLQAFPTMAKVHNPGIVD